MISTLLPLRHRPIPSPTKNGRQAGKQSGHVLFNLGKARGGEIAPQKGSDSKNHDENAPQPRADSAIAEVLWRWIWDYKQIMYHSAIRLQDHLDREG